MTCNHCTIIRRMPVVQRFANCRVRINPKDHPPPYFHVQLNDGREAWVSIDPIEIIHRHVATRETAAVLGSFAIRVEPRLPCLSCSPAVLRQGRAGGGLLARRSAPLTPYRQNTFALCSMRRFIA